MKIEVMDYTKRGPKGNVAGRRVTVYQVNATDAQTAKAKAMRTHQRRVATGQLSEAVVTKGAAVLHPTYSVKVDYQIL